MQYHRYLKKKNKDKILFITENVVSHESRFIDRFLTKIGLSNASKFLVLSNKVKEEIASKYPDKTVYKSELPIYNCYDTNKALNGNSIREKFGFKESDRVLLFFGYIRHYKGLDILIEALSIVLPYRTATQSGILNMAYGFLKPVVITNVGGLAEFVDRNKTGVIVELSEASSVAAGVQSFFDLRQKVDFTAEISRYIEKNSFSSISAVFEEILGNQNKE